MKEEKLLEAFKNVRVTHTIEVLKDLDHILFINKTDVPPDTFGIYQWKEKIKDLMEQLSELLKDYDLTIEDIPENLYKYDKEDDEYV